MNGLLYRLRSIKSWPSTDATVTSTEVVDAGGRSGLSMNVFFQYNAGLGLESGKLFVDSNSSAYGLTPGETFPIQFNPAKPSSYYCSEAGSLSRTIRRVIQIVGVTFALTVLLIELLAHSKH